MYAAPAPRSQVDLPLLAARVTAMLEARIPLTLLIDLADPQGPRSHDLYVSEQADRDWLLAAH